MTQEQRNDLDDIISPVSERVHPSDYADAPYISLEHIGAGTGTLIGHGRGSDVRSAKFAFKAGDILYGRLRPYLNKVAVAPFDGICSTDIIVMRPLDSVNIRLVRHLLAHPRFVAHATHRSQGDLPRVSFAALKEVHFDWPEPAEQESLVDRCDQTMSLIRSASERVSTGFEKLKRARLGLLKDAFSGRLTNSWREEHVSSASDESVFDALDKQRREEWDAYPSRGRRGYMEPQLPKERLELPKSWLTVTVDQLAFVRSGNTPRGLLAQLHESGDYPWFQVRSLNVDRESRHLLPQDQWLTQEGVESLRLNILPTGSFVFPKRGGAIATNKKRILAQPSICDLNIMAMTPLSGFEEFLWWWFQTIGLGRLADGSNVPQINHPDIKELLVPLPPLPERTEIVRICEEVMAAVATAIENVALAGPRIRIGEAQVLESALQDLAVSVP